MTTTREFTAVLRDQVATTQGALLAAQRGGLPRQVYRHSVRLLDLLDRAARNDVDSTGWVPEDTLAAAFSGAIRRIAASRPGTDRHPSIRGPGLLMTGCA